jgi:hypothetical protein
MAMLKFDESLPVGPPPPELSQAMGEYAAEGARNGTLVDQGGLLPSAAGAIVSLVDGTIKAVDGPFTEAKEVVAGYSLLEVKTFEEAVEWAKRAPFGRGVATDDETWVELRPLFDPSEWDPA